MTIKQRFFKIGEISKLYNIGVDSIRYYEEVGVIKPTRDPVNNYRLYSFDDMRKITMIRELLALNFSMDEIKYFEENRTLSTTIKLLNKELQLINEKIDELTQQKANIINRLACIDDIINRASNDRITVLDMPLRKCLMVSETNIPDSYVDYTLVKHIHRYQQKVDTIGTCNCYTLDIPGSNPKSLYYRTKNVFFYSDYPTYEPNFMLPAGKYLSLIYKGDSVKTRKLLPSLINFAKDNHMKIIGDPIEFCPIDNYETSNIEEYITELQLPVSTL